MKSKNLHNQKGFTIVELLVAMTLFTAIITISITTFLKALKTQRAIVALVAVNDNAGLFIEQLAREIRLGNTFSVSSDNSVLQFNNSSGQTVVYQLNEGRIEKQTDGGTFVPQTASNVNIDSAQFVLVDSDASGNPTRPRITVALRVASKSPELTDMYTDIQTTMSPRALSQP